MRNFGQLWQDCNAEVIPKGEWDYQRRLTIDGVVYHDEDILGLTHDKGLLYNTFSLGNTISSTLKATVVPHTTHTVNRGGKLLLELRIATLNNGETDWEEFGHYYINRAEKERDAWTITALDAISKLEGAFETNETNWPKSINYGLNEILNYLDIELDPRSNINTSLQMSDPSEYTMREALGYIGSLHGGNWCVTETNKLRLIIPNIDSNPSMIIKPGNTKKIISSNVMIFDKIIVKYGGSKKEKHIAGSGDNELEIYNPWGTQDTANSIKNLLNDYEYYPGEAKSIEVDPAIELGDTISFNGNLANLWQINYSSRMYADIKFPEDTDNFQDTFEFVAGGDYDLIIQDHEDRITALENKMDVVEDILGLKGCEILHTSNISRNRYIGSATCIIVPDKINPVGIFGPQDWKDINSLFKETRVSKLISGENSKIDDIRNIFEDSKANYIDISKLNTSNVKNMSSTFRGAEAYRIKLNGVDLSNVENMSRTFSKTQMNDLNLSKLNLSNVKNMSETFEEAHITELNLSSLDLSKVENMRGMFTRANIGNLNINSIVTNNVKDMGWMFYSAYIPHADLSSLDTSSVTNMSLMFGNFETNKLNISTFNTSNVINMFGMFSTLNIFEKIHNLDLRHFDTSNVTDMSSMFYQLNTDNLDISSFDTSNVTRMGSMFNRTNIDTINISNFNTSNVTNFFRMFYNSKAKKIDASNLSTESATTIEQMFMGCNELNTLDLSGQFFVNDVTDNGSIFPRRYGSHTVPLTVYCNANNINELRNNYIAEYVGAGGISDHNISFVVK